MKAVLYALALVAVMAVLAIISLFPEPRDDARV
jgi:hypothetical protein